MRWLLTLGIIILFSSPIVAQDFPLFFRNMPVHCVLPANGPLLRAWISKQFKEAPFIEGFGKIGSGIVTEVWRTLEGDSWTITVTFKDSSMCIISAGGAIRDINWVHPDEQFI